MKESDIVNHIVNNWDKYFPDLTFYLKEKQWKSNWRPDITAYKKVSLGNEYGFDKEYSFKSPYFIEVKYNRLDRKSGKYVKNDRDLIFEVQKALDSIKRCKYPQRSMVILNDLSDPSIVNFLISNKVMIYKYKTGKRDFSDFSIDLYVKPTLRRK